MIFTASVLYILCFKTSKSRTIAFTSTMFTFALHILMWIYNYNYLTIMLVLTIILLFLGEKEHDYLIAFFFGVLPLIKQSTGVILLVGFLVICLWEMFYEKKDKWLIVRKCVLAAIPMIAYFIYLLITDSFWDFWEYAVLGILTFTHRTTYISFAFSSPIWFVFALFPWIVFGCAICEFIKHGYDGQKVRCTIIGLACLSLAYPLCDAYHFCSAIIPLIPIFFMFVRCRRIGIFSAILCNAFALGVMILSIISGTAIFSDEYIASSINNYENVPITKSVEHGICRIDDYIKHMKLEGYEVFIADESAAAYMIPLDSYRKNWDMLLVGNIGLATCQTLLETDQPSVYLVARDDTVLSKQAYFELINFIRNNYTCIDEVLGFDVYRN